MLLRQYFMSLKVLGRWRRWAASMGKHWGGVHDGLHQAHPVREPKIPGKPQEHDQDDSNHHVEHVGGGTRYAVANDGLETMPSLVGKAQRDDHSNPVRKKHQTNGGDRTQEYHQSDSEDDHSDLKSVPTEVSQRERELVIMRKVMRKWWRLAGLQGHPNLCDELGEDFGVHWTKVRPQGLESFDSCAKTIPLQGIAPKLEGRIREKKA